MSYIGIKQSTEGFTWISGYCDDCKMVILWFHFPFYINFLFYYKKALSFSFIHLSSGWAHGFLFYSVSYNPLFPLFMLVLRLSQLCTVSALQLFPISCYPFPYPSLYEYFLTSWHINLYFPCLSPGVHHFSKEPRSVRWGTVYSFLCGCQEECF